MNDQERLTDFLVSEKKMSDNYNTFASECVSLPLRDEFLKIFNQTHTTQSDLFKIAQSKGWYNPEQAPANKITQIYNKYSSQKPG